MSYLTDFPNTHFYDQDLGWLIKKYKELNNDYNTLVEIYELIQKDIESVTIEQLQKWLDDGTFETIINETIFNNLNEKVDLNTSNIEKLKNVSLSVDFFQKETTDTSDSERIQRAIDYLHSLGGGTLLFPVGTYNIDKTLNLYDNIELHGSGSASTVFNIISNISFSKSFEKTSRHDNIVLQDFKIIRNVNDCNTAVLDFEYISWSKLININVYQGNSQQLNEGCIGLLLGNFSYYNYIEDCVFRYFNIGIQLYQEANGNSFVGGGCISCGKYGVYINKTNSSRFFGHSVELVAKYAYYLNNKSLNNSFFGCRIEGTERSYKMGFENGGLSSINNLIVGGLDYSTNKEEISATNYNASAVNLFNAERWGTHTAFMCKHNFGQGSFNTGEYRVLQTSNILYDRNSNVTIVNSSALFTVPTTGLYNINCGIETTTAQDGVTFGLYKNGSLYREEFIYKGVNDKKFSCSFSVYLETEDEVQLYIKATNTTNIIPGDNTFVSGCNL